MYVCVCIVQVVARVRAAAKYASEKWNSLDLGDAKGQYVHFSETKEKNRHEALFVIKYGTCAIMHCLANIL